MVKLVKCQTLNADNNGFLIGVYDHVTVNVTAAVVYDDRIAFLKVRSNWHDA
jgi:hypothetical protein